MSEEKDSSGGLCNYCESCLPSYVSVFDPRCRCGDKSLPHKATSTCSEPKPRLSDPDVNDPAEQLARATRRIKDLEVDLDNWQAAGNRLNDLNDRLIAEREALIILKNKQIDSIQSLEANVEYWQSKFLRAEEEAEKDGHALAALGDRIAELEEVNRDLAKTVREYGRCIDNEQRRVRELEEDNSELKRQLDNAIMRISDKVMEKHKGVFEKLAKHDRGEE